jgi:hypothetical protein
LRRSSDIFSHSHLGQDQSELGSWYATTLAKY